MAMLSRVADSLYWMSRYLERTEHTARLLDVTQHQLIDVDVAASQQRWHRLWQALHYNEAMAGSHEPSPIVELFTADSHYPDSLVASITAARENARQVREHISSEMWEQINRLYLDIRQQTHDHRWKQATHRFYGMVKAGSHLFQGITDATMIHNEGWNFIQIGRALERANNTASLLYSHLGILQAPSDEQGAHHAEWVALLKMCSAFEAYCKVHTPEVTPPRMMQFVVYDAVFPRSIRFCADSIHASTLAIGANHTRGHGQSVQRIAGRFQALLEYGGVDDELSTLALNIVQVQEGCNQIGSALHEVHIDYAIDSTLSN
jgi:uncharacterized alpha-E superfamily protein